MDIPLSRKIDLNSSYTCWLLTTSDLGIFPVVILASVSLTQADYFTKDFLKIYLFQTAILNTYTPRWPLSIFNFPLHMANYYNISDMIFMKNDPSRLQTPGGASSVSSPYFLNVITSSTVMCIQKVLNDRWAIELGNNVFHVVSH